jgi:hypothetical protein
LLIRLLGLLAGIRLLAWVGLLTRWELLRVADGGGVEWGAQGLLQGEWLRLDRFVHIGIVVVCRGGVCGRNSAGG